MKKGFTLVEVLVVMAVIFFLAVIIIPVSLNFYNLQVFNETHEQIIGLLKQARSNAFIQKNNADFGLYFGDKQMVLFQGPSYGQRDESQDFSLKLPALVEISGFSEIVFSQGSALPKQSGSLLIKSGQKQKEIIINEQGLISY
ncbi:MAG TPA: prepilin-type N-terminal cleavage/methylation domain-containing protein [Candidatus Uhrbacteria bacterium]|nr:prepilin-type N-terminal cleavage/methylation domain-containing protein [Candidatus Uhrbacteria bacterium]